MLTTATTFTATRCEELLSEARDVLQEEKDVLQEEIRDVLQEERDALSDMVDALTVRLNPQAPSLLSYLLACLDQ